MAELRQNTWTLNQWYDQSVAGDVEYSGEGQLWMSGKNNEYQLDEAIPNSPNSRISSPVQLSGNWIDAGNSSDGGICGFGVRSDGSVWVWGKGSTQLSLGLNEPSNTQVSSPKQVMAAPSTGYKSAISAFETEAFVVQDGKLWSWGYNMFGGLGLNEGGPTSKKSSPTQVGTDENWSKNFDNTGYEVLATKTDGSLWAWGGTNSSQTYGQLGQNGPDNTQLSSPTQIGTDTDWGTGRNQITLSKTAGCVKSTGELFMWGRNGDEGLLGLNESGGQDANSRSSPIQLPGTTWKSINVSNSLATAVKTDGSLWTWGNNVYGGLGLNQQGQHFTPASFSSPKQVGTNTDWAYSWARNSGCWATKTDGTLWVWGGNGPTAKLGLNDQANRSSPTQIPGTDWTLDRQLFGTYRDMLFRTL